MKTRGVDRATAARVLRWTLVTALVWLPTSAQGQKESVVGTVHNLSQSGPGEIRSLDESEVCKFCHIPHNAVSSEALWGHVLPRTEYRTPEIRRGRPDRQTVPQPDGSSRLCLSCHDGTVALGELGGQKPAIRMAGADRLTPGDRGFLGTDLSGSHPVSVPMTESSPDFEASDADIGLLSRTSLPVDSKVKLDERGKVQCTTCHDPHSDANYIENRVPRFWVAASVDEVCRTCHVAN